MSRKKLVAGLSALSAALLSLPANAAIVQLCGPTICYEYDNNPAVNAGITLFQAPSLLAASDTLEFTPTAFNAFSANGAMVTTQAIFQFTRIWAPGGEEIQQITVAESGDYRIINGGLVSASLRLQVVDKSNEGVGPFPEVLTDIQNFNTAVPTGFTPQNWSLTSSLFPAAQMLDPAVLIDLQIQNTLDAFTFASGEQAFIAKKLTLNTTVVPVPAAVWLMGSGLALLGFLRRRAVSLAA
jgi:hypothetical protein